MKYTFVLIIAFFAQVLMGQDNDLYNVNFAQLDTTMCQGKIVATARYWEVYQILNDQWDGERDTTKCYNVSSNEYSGFISSHNFQFNKKIFRRYVPDTLKSLEPNKIYGAFAGAYIPFGHYNQDCEGMTAALF